MSELVEWFAKNRRRYPRWTKAVSAAAKQFGLSHRNVTDAVRVGPPPAAKPAARPPKKVGFSREEFLSTHDADTKMRLAIQRAVEALIDDEIIPDADFRLERCKQATAGWRHVADEEEFRPYQFHHKGKIYWATRKTVAWAIGRFNKAREL